MRKRLIPWVWLTVYCQSPPGWHENFNSPGSQHPGSGRQKTPNSGPWRICMGRDDCIFTYTDVSENSGFSPQIIHFNKVFYYKASILGYPYFWKHPYMKTHQKINEIHVGKYIQFPSSSHGYMSWMSFFFRIFPQPLNWREICLKQLLDWESTGQVLGQQDLESYPRLQRPFVDRWGVGWRWVKYDLNL